MVHLLLGSSCGSRSRMALLQLLRERLEFAIVAHETEGLHLSNDGLVGGIVSHEVAYGE